MQCDLQNSFRGYPEIGALCVPAAEQIAADRAGMPSHAPILERDEAKSWDGISTACAPLPEAARAANHQMFTSARRPSAMGLPRPEPLRNYNKYIP